MADNSLIKYEEVELCQMEHIILQDINLEIGSGEFIFLIGKVGSGKSTFLKSLYGEIPVSNGTAKVFDFKLSKLKRKEYPALRRKIGIVFQDFKLLTDRSVHANLEFVLKATGWKNKNAINDQIDQVLQQVGMPNKGYKYPHQLSGGEQQRIVIARALLNSPEIIVADEPTGNLDPDTGKEIMDLLYAISQAGTTILVATHNLGWVESYPGRVIDIEDQKMSIREEENV